jgi:hypothetical protein
VAPSDEIRWSVNYFFYNKQLKKLAFFACWIKSKLRSGEDDEMRSLPLPHLLSSLLWSGSVAMPPRPSACLHVCMALTAYRACLGASCDDSNGSVSEMDFDID